VATIKAARFEGISFIFIGIVQDNGQRQTGHTSAVGSQRGRNRCPTRGLTRKRGKEHGREGPCGRGTARFGRIPEELSSGNRGRPPGATSFPNRGCPRWESTGARTEEPDLDPVGAGNYRTRRGSTLHRTRVIRRRDALRCPHKRRSPCPGPIRTRNAKTPAPTGVPLIRSLRFSRYALPHYRYSFGGKRSTSNPPPTGSCSRGQQLIGGQTGLVCCWPGQRLTH
jgi:hypothetical protein